jgi:hypothetical protein
MDKAHPAGLARERAWLQATVAVLSLVPITAGAAGLLLGPGFAGGPAGVPDLASHFAYLSGLLLGLGLGFLALVPGIEHQGLLFRSAAGLVVLGGLARLLAAAALAGPPSLPHRLALVMELGVVPAIAAWQARIARRCAALSVA